MKRVLVVLAPVLLAAAICPAQAVSVTGYLPTYAGGRAIARVAGLVIAASSPIATDGSFTLALQQKTLYSVSFSAGATVKTPPFFFSYYTPASSSVDMTADIQANAPPVVSNAMAAVAAATAQAAAAQSAMAAKQAIGPQGPKGDTGPQGIPGVAGASGKDGAAGTTGAAGKDGAQGLAGAQGVPGAAGTPGASVTGAQGLPGKDGAAGIQGIQGIQGVQGLQGIQGVIGPAYKPLSAMSSPIGATSFPATATLLGVFTPGCMAGTVAIAGITAATYGAIAMPMGTPSSTDLIITPTVSVGNGVVTITRCNTQAVSLSNTTAMPFLVIAFPKP